MADARIQIVMDGVDKTQAMFKGVSGRIDGVADSLRRMRGPALAVTGLFSVLGFKSVNAASDLGEAINKAGLAFRDAIGPVEEFAKTSAQSIGISQKDALDYTAVLGTIINASGLTRKASADMAVEMTKLAADLASVNNIPIADALAAIRSGLVGEVEPLRRFGILLSASALEAKALELGLIKQGEAMTEAAKVQARSALIFEATADQQGDAVNTAESFANAQKRLGAQLTDLAADIGVIVVPHLEKLLKFMNDGIGIFSQLTDRAKMMIFAVGGISAGLGALILILPFVLSGFTALISVFSFAVGIVGTLASGIALLSLPLALVIAGVVALAVAWQQNWFGMRDIVSQVTSFIDKGITLFVNGIITTLNGLITAFNVVSRALPFVDELPLIGKVDSAFKAIGNTVDKVKEVAGDTFGGLKNQLTDILFKTDLEVKGLGDVSKAMEDVRFGAGKVNDELGKTNELLSEAAEGVDLTALILSLEARIANFLAAGGNLEQIQPLLDRLSHLQGLAAQQGGAPSMQSGGIVPGPIGRATPIIAHGGEEIIPAERVGGGNTIVVNAMSLGADPLERRRVVEEIAAEIGLLLAEEQRTR